MYGKSRRPVGPAPGTQEQIQSFRKDRPYGPEGIHRILRQAAGGTSEQEHTLPDVLWNHESHMRFPTDMKLLWESIEWLYSHICRHCRELGIRRPRNKYRNVAESYLSYCKKRKRRASRTRMLKRRMIKLLEKLLSQRDGIHSEYGALLRYTQDYHKRLSIIRKVLVQEKEMFEGRKVSDRIVSIDRHYVRPIVRGKETKSVEFGAKVNNIQIDGISFIEHLSFKAFNEGIRLKDCIRMQQKLMNVRVRCVAADSIYANNANRKFCTKYGISTSFVRKGRAAKDEPLRKVLRSELSKERATRLEGSFGTQKQHYSLARIKQGTGRQKSCEFSSEYIRQMPY